MDCRSLVGLGIAQDHNNMSKANFSLTTTTTGARLGMLPGPLWSPRPGLGIVGLQCGPNDQSSG